MFSKNLTFSTLIVIFLSYKCCCQTSPIPNEILECDDEDLMEVENDEYTYYNFSHSELINFLYITPENETINLNSTSMIAVNITKPTKILIHGLGSFENNKWIDKVVYNYHTKGDYNIIAVDWTVISQNETFFSSDAIDSVGNIIGTFIIDVIQTNVDYLRNIHLIGSSVGAQIAGSAGKMVSETTNQKIDRITGLDPTEPQDTQHLDVDKAEFVDVIHTTIALGESNVGTVNFYVTGDDPTTPVCYNGTCEDLSATEYFSHSIVDAYRFYGISCYNASYYVQKLCDKANNATLGEYVSRNISGSYLVSKASDLFNQREYGLAVTFIVILWHLYC